MSWLDISPDSPFSIENIPFGIISTRKDPKARPAVAIGDFALDLATFSQNGGFNLLPELQKCSHVFEQSTLNAFAELGQEFHSQCRKYLQDALRQGTDIGNVLRDQLALRDVALIPLKDCTMHLPMRIGDYTDFYAGMHHAYNAGVLFRGPETALQPNYKHLPVGYHGRASTVVVSGTPIRRPKGQILPDPMTTPKRPQLSPSEKMDLELELAAFVCKPNKFSEPIPIDSAKEYIFGIVLMNDWSARDIQAWEAVPLGPFLGKSFGTTISPWIVLTEALEGFLTQGLESGSRETILPYLRDPGTGNAYDIRLEVDIIHGGQSTTICRTSGKNLLFSFPQMLAHHTINGCAMNSGDLLGSGTISGTEPGTQGSLLEQSENGKKLVQIGKLTRTFLEDGDEVVIKGICGERGSYVGFGECRGRILPALI